MKERKTAAHAKLSACTAVTAGDCSEILLSKNTLTSLAMVAACRVGCWHWLSVCD